MILCITISSTRASSPNEVNLVANNWCPQHCEKSEKSPGYIVEIVKKAFASQKVKVNLQFRPWLRAVNKTHQGKVDGLLTPSDSEETNLLRHKITLYKQKWCFYVRIDRKKIKALPDLKGLSITLIKSTNLGPEFTDYIKEKSNKILVKSMVTGEGNSPKRMFKYLISKRTDAIALTEDAADYYLGQAVKESFHVEKQICTKDEGLRVGFSYKDTKRSQYLMKKLDDGLKYIIKSGERDSILKKYYLK